MGEEVTEWCGISMSAAVMSMILTLGMFSSGLEMEPLRFPTFEEKASLKLQEILAYDGSRDKDIFETLERYNEVYKTMFTTLGTPYEMAKITNNREAKKEILEKNNQLILQGLLTNKFARDNATINL